MSRDIKIFGEFGGKMKLKIAVSVVSILLIILCSCGSKEKTLGKEDFEDKFKILLSESDLASAGFENLDPNKFGLLVKDPFLYVFNSDDKMIVKFQGKNPVKKYKASGPGPKEFLNIRSEFFDTPNTIAVFDMMKKSVLYFDLDLNFIKEIKLINQFFRLGKTDSGYIGLLIDVDYIFALLDKNFNTVESFIKPNRKAAFEKMYPFMLYKGYLVDERTVAHSERVFTKKDCIVDIYDLVQKKIIVTLKWQQRNTPTQKDINRRYLYNAGGVYKYDTCYIDQNWYSKGIDISKVKADFLIFKTNGECVLNRFDPDYTLLYSNDKSRIYLYFEEKGIYVANAKDIIN
jgi:hypothetical protein